jgi:signal transduction histidine kinase
LEKSENSLMNEAEIKLLVIDDDPGAFTLVSQMLLTVERLRIALDWVDSFEKGLSALQENNHDIYLVDYRLGNEDGINLIRKASEMGIDVPAILLTAYGTYDVDLAVMRLGAMDYLDKRHLTSELLERSIRYAIERKRNERELKRLHKKIASLEQLKTDMIRIAAHDLKNPITSILLNVEMLEKVAKKIDVLEVRQRIESGMDSVKHSTLIMKTITTSILSLEHIEELHRSSLYAVELSPLVQAAYQEFLPQAKSQSQELTLKLPDEPVHVLGDTTLLAQVVTNLLENAVKYTQDGGCIEVRLKKTTDAVIFEVEDNGCGVPEKHQEKIFQPFVRLKNNNEVAGTGLGLYLVKSIVLRHDGCVIFHSVPEQGSVFGFSLPLHAIVEPDV